MPDREKVIKGLECCHVMVHDLGPDKTSCGICPYKDVQTEEQIDLGGIECIAVLHDDALSLLKEQEPVAPVLVGRMWECGKCHAPVGIFMDDQRDQFADICNKYLAKGRKVSVVGPVSVHTYTAQNGEFRADMDVMAKDVEFLSPKGDGMTPVNDPDDPFMG